MRINVTLSDEQSVVTPNTELSIVGTEEVRHDGAYEVIETHSIAVEEESDWENWYNLDLRSNTSFNLLDDVSGVSTLLGIGWFKKM